MKKLILNHKSYLSYEEISTYKKELENLELNNIDLILMPNIAYLSLFKDTNLKIGSQNFYSYNFGSYTGEISLETLKSLNINYTLIGHPERIKLKLDTYSEIKDKLFRSINSNFKTILCIGYKENIKTIKKELKYYLESLKYENLKNLIIAYEPPSKIESQKINLKEIYTVKNFIKNYIKKHYDEEIEFIYGGGITKENIKEVLKITDGIILGKNSINIEELKEIIKLMKESDENE